MNSRSRHLIFLAACMVGLFGALGATIAPWIGLGDGEAFVLWQLVGISRSDAAGFAIALAVVGGSAQLFDWSLGHAMRELRQPKNPSERGPAAEVVSSIAITCLTILVFSIVAEAWLRLTVPFNKTAFPIRLDPAFGSTLIPGAEVKWTNHVDFWQVSRVNSLGFLDNEPPAEQKEPGTCRVAFIGDSFVEAAQVAVEEKVQVLFKELASEKMPGKRFETFALGFSGTGQANQLQFYDFFARRLKPDVIVLVVVNNDYANNSAILEAVRNNWHPDRPPRLFFRRNSEGQYESLMPSLPPAHLTPPELVNAGLPARLNQLLGDLSYSYRWLQVQLATRFPSLRSVDDPLPTRMAALASLPGYEHVLAGWNYPKDLPIDAMFTAETMPTIFEEAVAATGYAFDEFLKRGQRDGFKLVALASHSLSLDPQIRADGRSMVESGHLRRLEALLKPRGIVLADQSKFIAERNITLEGVQWSRDGHWNRLGHRIAAETLLQTFKDHPELCGNR